jgi:hypothetical protein
VCPQFLCTTKYKKTSIQSIAQHRDQCAARPFVKQWEAEREERRVSQLLRQELQNLRQQLHEMQRQKEELQRHNAFLIQQARTTGAAQPVFFDQFPETAYHQHYHQYPSTNCAINPTTWPPYTFGPPPPPPAPTLFPVVPRSTFFPPNCGHLPDIASPTKVESSLPTRPSAPQPTADVQSPPQPFYFPMAYGPEPVFLSPHHILPMQWHPVLMYPQPTLVSGAVLKQETARGAAGLPGL